MTVPPYAIWENIDKKIRAEARQVIELRRHLHSYPELSRQEFKTTQLLAEKLQTLGFEVTMREQGVGLYADLSPPDFDPEVHPTIAIRSDIDALPVLELNEVPYASKHKGVMHACGHDVHMATVMGSGLGMLAARDQLPGRLRLIYQHAEEIVPGGALDMVAFGAVDDVDAILGLHVDPELKVGQVGVRKGAFCAAFDTFELKVVGKGGHGARPHQCIDPIFVITQIATSLYQATSRNFDARLPAVITIGSIQGGGAANVIPEEAMIKGSIRTISPEHREEIEPLLRQISAGICMTHGASYELKMERGAPAIYNDPHITQVFIDVVDDMIGPNGVYHIPLPSMGGEDFSCYLERVPGAMCRLGTGAGGPVHFLHSAYFDIDERAISIGSRLLARSALRLMYKFSEQAKRDKNQSALSTI